MFGDKLKQGDEIRIVAPSRSFKILGNENVKLATAKLEKLGFKVTYSNNLDEVDEFLSSTIEDRVNDLHDAFKDKKVKCILTAIGGYNSNQLLKYLDYNLIKENPKIICGYSDITALLNAIYKKTGLVTYNGPHFSTFAIKEGNDYTIEYFLKCVMNKKSYSVEVPEFWSNDTWWVSQESRDFIENEGPYVINKGTAKGTLIGGNLSTFALLQGTEYMPNLENSILMIEDDELTSIEIFDRQLQGLIHQNGFEEVKALLIGRFETKSKVSKENIRKVINSKKELRKIPVICDLDFSHTDPKFTFPIGGTGEIEANGGEFIFNILEH